MLFTKTAYCLVFWSGKAHSESVQLDQSLEYVVYRAAHRRGVYSGRAKHQGQPYVISIFVSDPSKLNKHLNTTTSTGRTWSRTAIYRILIPILGGLL
jgi:hypothetical protein